MATLYITEYGGISFVGAGTNQKVEVPALAAATAFNSITLSATSAASAAFATATHYVEMCSDTDCFIKFSTTSTTSATHANSSYLPAKMPRLYAVNPAGFIVAIL